MVEVNGRLLRLLLLSLLLRLLLLYRAYAGVWRHAGRYPWSSWYIGIQSGQARASHTRSSAGARHAVPSCPPGGAWISLDKATLRNLCRAGSRRNATRARVCPERLRL